MGVIIFVMAPLMKHYLIVLKSEECCIFIRQVQPHYTLLTPNLHLEPSERFVTTPRPVSENYNYIAYHVLLHKLLLQSSWAMLKIYNQYKLPVNRL